MISTKYGKMNVIPADRIVSHSLSLYGEWAGDELNFLRKVVTPGMCVLDIGAFIGTHTLAFAEFVGDSGSVYSFEPRREIFQILCSNIALNEFKYVQPFNMGLAEAVGSIAIEAIDISESVNFGGLSIDDVVPKDVKDIYEVNISTVDALDISAVDFMKLDVEGMERKVLEGAVKVIERDQPLIFCECNSLASGFEVFEFCKPLGYRVFGLLSAAYNPENFNNCTDNIFGDAKEVSLLLVPVTKISLLNLDGSFDELFEITNLEDFVLPLLHKPQYAHEVLTSTSSFSKLGLDFYSPLVQRERELMQRERELMQSERELMQRERELSEVTLSDTRGKLEMEVEQRQQQIYSLHTDIQGLLTSNSWRLTKPLRVLSSAAKNLLKLLSTIFAYQKAHPGVSGLTRLINGGLVAFKAGGLRGVKAKLQQFRRLGESTVETSNLEAKQNAVPMAELNAALNQSELLVNTIIFDHNGGGGSNIYTSELIASTVTEGASILRVYSWGGDWYVLVCNNGTLNNKLYSTGDLAELFACLKIAHADRMIINSLYGYKNIARVIDEIISLRNVNACGLDFKVHDFHSLCPSPHLSDYEQKYCGIPSDREVCNNCLPRNLSWYHSWYAKSDMATDIDKWREPFQRLFEACSVITCFDESSIDILNVDFVIDQSKYSVVPHKLRHFKSERKLSIGSSLSIGVIGTLSHIKGGDIVKALCSYIDEKKLGVPLTVIGQSYTDLPASAKVYGSYSPAELPSLVEELGVNVVFMASIVPETFSYTISEAIEMGLPIIAFDIGAQGRRVKEYRLGEVVPVGASPEAILTAAKSIYEAAKE